MHIATHETEAEFQIHELFFSHTDRKGIILFGNDIFERVAEYPAGALIGKPHNTIRHPDMPKCVFKTLWDYLTRNEPIVAYVKNRSFTGKYYWVLALAFPFQEGYLSIRLKPTSPLMKVIPELYRQLSISESNGGITASTTLLQKAINDQGFQAYSQFMIHCLAQEIRSRDLCLAQSGKLNNPNSKRMAQTGALLESIYLNAKSLDSNLKATSQHFKGLEFLCINLATTAEKYGDSGATISITAEIFKKWGLEISQVLSDFSHRLLEFVETTSQARIATNFSYLQMSMALAFQQSAVKVEKYEESLNGLAKENTAKAGQSLFQLQLAFQTFLGSLEKLNESVLAMKIVQLSGRIEAIHLPDEGREISATIQEMVNFLTTLENSIRTLNDLTFECQSHIKAIS